MAMEHKEHVEEISDGNYARRERVLEVAPETRQVLVSRISRLMWLITMIIAGLLAFRFILLLIGANPGTSFVAFIYDITQVLIAPFAGIVASPALDGTSMMDVASLFAIAVYAIATWALVELFRILFSGTRSTRHVSTIERQK